LEISLMTYTPFPVWPRPSDEGGGVTSHGALTGRSSTDQHPIGAITGLQDALDGAGGAAAPEVVEVYVLATAAQLEAVLGAVATPTEITFSEAPSAVIRMLVEGDPGVWTSYTTDGVTEVAPVDTEQIVGSGAKFVFVTVDAYARGTFEGQWSLYAIDALPGVWPARGVTAVSGQAGGTSLSIKALLTADRVEEFGATYTPGVSIEFPDLNFPPKLYVHNSPYIDVFVADGTTTAPYYGRLGDDSAGLNPDIVVVEDDYTTPEATRDALWLRANGGNRYVPFEAFQRSVYSSTKTDDYTVTGRDFGGVIEMDAATDKTITLPSGGTYGFPQLALGVFVEFHNAGTGTLTIDHDANIVFTAGGTTVPTVTVLPGGSVKARCRVFDSTSEWAFTGDNEAWLWDGVTDYLPAYGARRFFGPNDPAGEGFTLADGDQWEDTTP
jgi:hypothetical protein